MDKKLDGNEWAKNLPRGELERDIGRICGGLKNQPHRFGGEGVGEGGIFT